MSRLLSQNNFLIAAAVLTGALMFKRSATAQPRAGLGGGYTSPGALPMTPGATPVIPAYLRTPGYAGMQTPPQQDMFSALGSAIGKAVNKYAIADAVPTGPAPGAQQPPPAVYSSSPVMAGGGSWSFDDYGNPLWIPS